MFIGLKGVLFAGVGTTALPGSRWWCELGAAGDLKNGRKIVKGERGRGRLTGNEKRGKWGLIWLLDGCCWSILGWCGRLADLICWLLFRWFLLCGLVGV